MVSLFPTIKIRVFAGLFFLTNAVLGQTNEVFKEYRAKFPGHHIVLLNDQHTIDIEIIKGVPRVVHHVREEHLVLDQNALLSLSEESIQFSSFENLTINEAYVMVPTEKGSKKIAVTNISTKDAESEGSVFHDDNKETKLIFPRMELGALRVLDYTIVMSEHRFPFGFHFSSFYPITNSKFEIVCDTSTNIFFKEYFLGEANIKFSNNVTKGKRTLSWTSDGPPIYKSEVGAPNRRYFTPHILAQIGDYSVKGQKINVLKSTDDLYKWYFENIREVVSEEPTKEIKSISDSIVKGENNEFEKVRKIYYWVQNNIKYVAFEEGINGFVPRQPSAIMQKRYGDCKDMASIIYSMLKAQGITSYLTWIGSRDIPYRYVDFPGTACDNHMINTYKYNGKNYFLDATNPFLSIHEVAGFTIGKDALLGISEDKYEIAQLPVPSKDLTTYVDTSFISIDGKKIKGSSAVQVDGYYQQMIHYSVSSTPKEKYSEMAKGLFLRGNNSFAASGVKVGNVSDRELPFDIKFDFVVDNYVTAYEDETYVNMVLEKDISFGEMAPDRIAPYEFDQKSADNYTVILEIPENKTVKSIPQNTKYTSDVVDFSMTYTQKGNKIFMTILFDIKEFMIQPEQFKNWNAYYKIFKDAVNQSIVLIDKK